jgi:hypothetical protein
MQLNKLAIAITSSLLSMGAAQTVQAHQLYAGALGATTTTGDVFTSSCFQWGAKDADGVTYGPNTAGDATGAPVGFRFAISLVTGNNVTATVGYTGAADVIANTYGQNILPASPTPVSATAGDTTTGAAQNKTVTSVTDFLNNGNSQAPYGASNWLAFPAGQQSGGKLVLVINKTGTLATTYDFLGHCQTAATGSPLSVHAGQGDYFASGTYTTSVGHTVTGTAPTEDYLQLIEQ